MRKSMYKKLVGIFVTMLLITTAISAVGVNLNKIGNEKPLALQNGDVDQQQLTHCGYGAWICPPQICAQSFKPINKTCTNVELYLFKYANPPSGIEITVSIRKNVDGMDLTNITINADDVGISNTGTWVNFDFDDIKVTPEETYYIVCSGDGGDTTNTYCWFFDTNDKYPRGEAWLAPQGTSWARLDSVYPQFPDPDFCFITYSKKAVNNPSETNILFFRFLQNNPRIFQILQQLLGLL